MLAPILTLEESEQYGDPSFDFQKHSKSLKKKVIHAPEDTKFKMGLHGTMPDKYVKVRLLCSTNLDVDIRTRLLKDPIPKSHQTTSCFCVSKSLRTP